MLLKDVFQHREPVC